MSRVSNRTRRKTQMKSRKIRNKTTKRIKSKKSKRKVNKKKFRKNRKKNYGGSPSIPALAVPEGPPGPPVYSEHPPIEPDNKIPVLTTIGKGISYGLGIDKISTPERNERRKQLAKKVIETNPDKSWFESISEMLGSKSEETPQQSTQQPAQQDFDKMTEGGNVSSLLMDALTDGLNLNKQKRERLKAAINQVLMIAGDESKSNEERINLIKQLLYRGRPTDPAPDTKSEPEAPSAEPIPLPIKQETP